MVESWHSWATSAAVASAMSALGGECWSWNRTWAAHSRRRQIPLAIGATGEIDPTCTDIRGEPGLDPACYGRTSTT